MRSELRRSRLSQPHGSVPTLVPCLHSAFKLGGQLWQNTWGGLSRIAAGLAVGSLRKKPGRACGAVESPGAAQAHRGEARTARGLACLLRLEFDGQNVPDVHKLAQSSIDLQNRQRIRKRWSGDPRTT